MQKIISLFKRDYEGTRLVYDEIVPGAEWVSAGEGIATIKYDGTCCKVEDGKLFKRYDRKLSKKKARRLKQDKAYIPQVEDYKPAPDGWQPAEEAPAQHTGHWPGWVPVGDGPEDKWHRQAFYSTLEGEETTLDDGTYELVGPKVQGNPYNLKTHHLWEHGTFGFRDFNLRHNPDDAGRDFESIKSWLTQNAVEGIVWHHPDGRMVKIKRKDFDLPWPVGNIKILD